MAAKPEDTWAVGTDYEDYVGRWSRRVAGEFLRWLDQAPGLDWADIGCGTGALSAVVLERMAPQRVSGVDASAEFVTHARANTSDPRATFQVADARALPFPDDALDVAVSGLVLNFVPDPLLAVKEMARVVRPSGVVAAYVWDYAGKMELMRYFWDAAVALSPGAATLDEGRRFPLCQPEQLEAIFRQAGLANVDVIALDIPTRFRDFADYWNPFLGGQGPAPTYAVGMAQSDRAALRERIRAALPAKPDGTIDLVARAWAVRGAVPG